MTFDWNVVIYLLGIAAVWGGMKAEISSLRRDFERLENKVEKNNHLVERVAVVEGDNKTAFRMIDELKEEINRD